MTILHSAFSSAPAGRRGGACSPVYKVALEAMQGTQCGSTAQQLALPGTGMIAALLALAPPLLAKASCGLWRISQFMGARALLMLVIASLVPFFAGARAHWP